MSPPTDDWLDAPEAHRRLCHCLELEWEMAAARLPSALRLHLRRPGFGLNANVSTLGQWLGEPVREIRISRRCVLNHPWYAVVDVLRHEMAHQLAEEVLAGIEDQGPHGDTFQRACRLLGIEPRTAARFTPLDEAAPASGTPEEERILTRVRKLLALGGSPNHHEAHRALAKARELMARHGVNPAPEGQDPDYIAVGLGEPALRHGLEMHALASLIRDHYGVHTVWIPSAVLRAGRLGRALEVCGTRRNVQLAHYAFDYIRHAIDAEWQRERGGTRGHGPHGRRDFALGLIRGFRRMLTEQEAGHNEVRALVRAGDAGLDAYFRQRHPRLRQTRAGRGALVNPDLMARGEATAQRLGLRRGIPNPHPDAQPLGPRREDGHRPRRRLGAGSP
ncbi:MAG: DUF2786 domain-containing protein [Lentisphaeria bacterium]|nr:DUF2786 domain-containing protein [Lentisphaeria bacterium]